MSETALDLPKYLRVRAARALDDSDQLSARVLSESAAEIERLRADLKIADDAIDRQRSAFARWSDLVKAVTTEADIGTCPPASHTMREMTTWRAGLTDDEREAISSALEIAAACRHGYSAKENNDE